MRMAAVSPHRTALITGASGGIGEATAAGLLQSLPTLELLILCNRDARKSAAAAASLRSLAPRARIEELPLDLASLASVRDCARAAVNLLGDVPRLDVAIFNAGVMACPLAYTADGLELQYGVNCLGHALLALSLERVLQRSLYVSSSAVGFARGRKKPPTAAEKTRGEGFDASKYGEWSAYGDSKLAMSMFARGRALAGEDALSLHPGVVNTELARHILNERYFEWSRREGLVQNALRAVVTAAGFKTPEQGAELSIQLATEAGKREMGALYLERNRLAPPFMAPLLQSDAECTKVTDDLIRFCERYVAENENGASLALEPQARLST